MHIGDVANLYKPNLRKTARPSVSLASRAWRQATRAWKFASEVVRESRELRSTLLRGRYHTW